MGSFNTTCFASNQTIATGDKCRVMVVVQQSTYRPVKLTFEGKTEELFGVANSTCYPDSFWRPCSGFMAAQYEDYGDVKLRLDDLCRSHVLSFFLELHRLSPVVHEGENKHHEVPLDFRALVAEKAPGMLELFNNQHRFCQSILFTGNSLDQEIDACWQDISHVANEHRLFLLVQGHLRPVQFAVIHQASFQELVASTAGIVAPDEKSFQQEAFLRRHMERAKFFAEERHVALSASLKGADMRAFYYADAMRERLASLDCSNSYPRGVESNLLRQQSTLLLAGGSEEDFIAALVPVLNERYAVAALENLNVRYSPMVYAGQDYSNDIGKDYASFVAKVSRKVCKERKAESA